jgi:hypothetical protein
MVAANRAADQEDLGAAMLMTLLGAGAVLGIGWSIISWVIDTERAGRVDPRKRSFEVAPKHEPPSEGEPPKGRGR